MAYPGIVVEVDWAGDNNFSHAASDVTEDIRPSTLAFSRGRNFSGQTIARAVAGRLAVQLRNREAKYRPEDPNSVIQGVTVEGKSIRVRERHSDRSVGEHWWSAESTGAWFAADSNDRFSGNSTATSAAARATLWSGFIDDIEYVDNRSDDDSAVIAALGNLSRLIGHRIDISPRSNQSTGAAMSLALTTGGIPASIRGTGGGTISIPRWFVKDEQMINVLRDLESTELGVFFEDADGKLTLQSRTARSTGALATSAFTLNDSEHIVKSIRILEIKRVANIVRVPVQTYSNAASAVLWRASGNIVVAAGTTVRVRAVYPTRDAPNDHVGVVSWTPVASGTDYVAQTNLSVTSSTVGEELEIVLTNSGGTDLTVTSLQARGVALVADTPLVIEKRDSTSIGTHGEREYPEPSPWFGSIAEASTYADTVIARHKDLETILRVEFQANQIWDDIATVDISRRVSVDIDGRTADYHIEFIGHKLDRGIDHRVTYILSPVAESTRPAAPLAPSHLSQTLSTLVIGVTEPYNGGSVITGYEARYRRVGTAAWTSTTPFTTTQTTLTRLTRGATYEMQVRAINAIGTSDWSRTGTGRVGFRAPSAPGAPTLTARTISTLTFSWSDPSDNGGDGISRYDYRYRRGTSGAWSSAVASTVRTATIEGLAESVSYQIQVRAVNGAGASTWSTSLSATTVLSIPLTPTGLSLTSKTRTGLVFGWNSAQLVTRYRYQYRVAGSATWSTAATTTTATATLSSLSEYTQYEFRVRAENASGNSGYAVLNERTDYSRQAIRYTSVGTQTISWPFYSGLSIKVVATSGGGGGGGGGGGQIGFSRGESPSRFSNNGQLGSAGGISGIRESNGNDLIIALAGANGRGGQEGRFGGLGGGSGPEIGNDGSSSTTQNGGDGGDGGDGSDNGGDGGDGGDGGEGEFQRDRGGTGGGGGEGGTSSQTTRFLDLPNGTSLTLIVGAGGAGGAGGVGGISTRGLPRINGQDGQDGADGQDGSVIINAP